MKRLSIANAEQEYVNNNGSKCPVCSTEGAWISITDNEVIPELAYLLTDGE